MQITTHKGTYQGQKIEVQRIHKSEAIKLHSEGKTVFIQSSNIPPFGQKFSDWNAVKMDNEIPFERQIEIFAYFRSGINSGYRVKFYRLLSEITDRVNTVSDRD